MASGKSTALAQLEQLGAATISSDAVVHELLGSDEVRDAVAARLGDEVIGADGALDRGAMAAKVFASEADREWLEELLWPRVRERVGEWYASLPADTVAAVVEVPLLFESGGEAVYHHTIAVVADEAVRAERAGDRGHEGVDQRTGRQLTQDEKASRADFVVRNDGTPEELREELARVLASLTG
jgi:dephospho-CoA kinase